MKFSEVTKNILIEIIKDDKSNLYLKYVAVFSLFDYQGQDIELMLLNLFCNSKDNNIRYAAYFSLIYRDSLIAEHACILGLSKKYGSTYIEEALAKLLKTQTSRNQDILICSLSRIPDKYYQKIFEMIKKENLIHANTELYHLYFTCKDHVYKSEIVKILSSFGDKKSKEYLLIIKTTGKEQNFLKNRMVVRFSE
jgi:hypothetical protein